MSADNWAICPACLHRTQHETIHVVDIETMRTFREDYEQGTLQDGRFFVRYKGRCTACGFHHEFSHEQNVVSDDKSV